jgi:isocitrate dehydrogenase
MSSQPTIIYTHTDEAPALATYSFLPVIQAFLGTAGVHVETRDISLAARILAAFPERLTEAQRVTDDLAELGRLATTPEANIIKLPNISASMPQMEACIAELRSHGFDLPDYPAEPATDAERDIKARYDRVKGSAVNPVLREGNSDRRAPRAVKEFAKKHPHRMGAWSKDSRTRVAHMDGGDFFGNERSTTMDAATTLRIEFAAADGTTTTLKDGIAVDAGEVVDGTFMSRAALVDFLAREVEQARTDGVLFSLHLKATMMKVSDPIMFGHAVRVFFAPVFEKHAATLARLGVDPNNGFGDVVAKIQSLPDAERAAIEADIQAVYDRGPAIAMVDSDRGITNLHVPSDVIIDASMPAMIREGGMMWNADGKTQECTAVIPDRSYAGVYQAVIDDCREHGALDPTTMGSVPNVGLMAKKAEEYGSHDTTFELPAAGIVRIVDASGTVLMEHAVEAGDIWRMCRVKDEAIRDWVKLAVNRARATGSPAVFWLDAKRAHDAQLIAKVDAYLGEHDTDGLEFHTMAPADACRFSLERARAGTDTISVTGNVLRDYNTDLFPILELGTSAKMLSIVPLMNGGGLFETGAGGSAPKHVQQFERENHLRWDSLGEFLALAASLEHLAERFAQPRAKVLAEALDVATGRYLEENRGPSRKAGERGNRTSHYWLARFWAEALAAQTADADIAAQFRPVADDLVAHEQEIVTAIDDHQPEPRDIGGYYQPDPARTTAAMRPSATFNAIIDGIRDRATAGSA